MSREELERIIPVSPPKVNRKMNPKVHSIVGFNLILVPCKVAIHLKTLTPVGMAIIIVAEVK